MRAQFGDIRTCEWSGGKGPWHKDAGGPDKTISCALVANFSRCLHDPQSQLNPTRASQNTGTSLRCGFTIRVLSDTAVASHKVCSYFLRHARCIDDVRPLLSSHHSSNAVPVP